MDRRCFIAGLSRHISGGFVLGSVGGAAAGAIAMHSHDVRQGRIGRQSYAQHGEDLALWNTFTTYLGIAQPTYLDIGAYDPVLVSNTYYFYKQGCRGVLVEPNPAHWERLASVRPGDRLVKAGIGTGAAREADFYIIGGPGNGILNTYDAAEAESIALKTGGQNYIERVIKSPLLNVNDVIAEHCPSGPNLVSIDVEGLDLAILKSWDFSRYRPQVFCVETLIFGGTQVEAGIEKHLLAQNYAVRGGSFVNTFFVDGRYLEASPNA